MSNRYLLIVRMFRNDSFIFFIAIKKYFDRGQN